MKVVYSYGSKFGVEGLATTVYHDARALHRHGMLQRLLCGFFRETDLPRARIRACGFPDRVLRKLAAYDRSEWCLHLQNVVYDAWASRQLERADAFVFWNTFGLRSLRRAKALGMRTVVQRGSTHPRFGAHLREQEYARWGARYSTPEARLRRKVAELEAADHVLIPNLGVRSSFVQYGIAEEKLVPLAGRAADVERYVPVHRNTAEPFRVLFVGALGFAKGVPYLLKAWQQLAWTDAELWLVGQTASGFGPLLKQYLGLPGLRVLGYLRDPLRAYQSADVFVLPTLDDASAKVTYEAMACGLPVITTPEATSEVRDGIEGFVVPARNAEVLAEHLERLRCDDELRGAMRVAARKRAEAFTWEAYGTHLVHVLEALR